MCCDHAAGPLDAAPVWAAPGTPDAFPVGVPTRPLLSAGPAAPVDLLWGRLLASGQAAFLGAGACAAAVTLTHGGSSPAWMIAALPVLVPALPGLAVGCSPGFPPWWRRSQLSSPCGPRAVLRAGRDERGTAMLLEQNLDVAPGAAGPAARARVLDHPGI